MEKVMNCPNTQAVGSTRIIKLDVIAQLVPAPNTIIAIVLQVVILEVSGVIIYMFGQTSSLHMRERGLGMRLRLPAAMSRESHCACSNNV